MSEQLQQLNAEIKSVRGKIGECDRGLQEAKQMYDHDPWRYMQQRVRLSNERQRYEQRLADLEYELRCEGGDPNEYRPASGAVWLPPGYQS